MPAPKQNRNAALDPDSNLDRSLTLRLSSGMLKRWETAAGPIGLAQWVREKLEQAAAREKLSQERMKKIAQAMKRGDFKVTDEPIKVPAKLVGPVDISAVLAKKSP